jgi:hypothetical protein
MAEPDPDGSVDWVYYRTEGADGYEYVVWLAPAVMTGGPKEVERTLKAQIGRLWDTVDAIRVSEERRLHGRAGLDAGPELGLPGSPQTGKHHL